MLEVYVLHRESTVFLSEHYEAVEDWDRLVQLGLDQCESTESDAL